MKQMATASTPSRSSSIRDAFDVILFERDQDLAVRVDPFANFVAQIARYQRLRLLPLDVVELRHAHTSQLEHVPKARGRYQCRSCSLLLENRVGRDRCAVNQLLDVVELDARLLNQTPQPIDDRAAEIVRCGENLDGPDCAVRTHEHDVGERATDVDPDAVLGCAQLAVHRLLRPV